MNGEQIPEFFESNEDPYVLEKILKHYLDGSLQQSVHGQSRTHSNESWCCVMAVNVTKPVFGSHAVKRLWQRHLPVDGVEQIAQVGVVVQENGDRMVKRGELNGKPIHVVMEKPNNVVISVYEAGQWDATIEVRRKKA